jgi:HSP20 family protein
VGTKGGRDGGTTCNDAVAAGLKREDVNVEVMDDAVIIQGERKFDKDEERDGIYRSERSYGSFSAPFRCRRAPSPTRLKRISGTASWR